MAGQRCVVLASRTFSPYLNSTFISSLASSFANFGTSLAVVTTEPQLKHLVASTSTTIQKTWKRDRQSFSHAVQGATCVILLSDTWSQDMRRFTEESELIAISLASPTVSHVLKLSCPERLLNARFPIGAEHRAVERVLQDLTQGPLDQHNPSSTAITIVRPGLLMDRFLDPAGLKPLVTGGVLSIPLSNPTQAASAPVAIADLSLAIARLVTDAATQHGDRATGLEPQVSLDSVALTGAERLSWNEMASILEQELKMPVRVSSIPRWAVQPSLWIKGKSPDAIRSYLDTYAFLSESGDDLVTESLQELLAPQIPTNFARFIAASKKEFN